MRDVVTIYAGYPREIAQENGNELSVNAWTYGELVGAIETKARERGLSPTRCSSAARRAAARTVGPW